MGKLILEAVAKLTHIDIASATGIVRQNPILEDEIHIEEELINLKESLDTSRAAAASLSDYPDMRRHIEQERRLILKHCVGLLNRMLYGKRLPRSYTEKDTHTALRRLVQLIIEDAIHSHKRIDADILEIVQSFMTLRQRVLMHQWSMPSLHDLALLPKIGWQKITPSRFRA